LIRRLLLMMLIAIDVSPACCRRHFFLCRVVFSIDMRCIYRLFFSLMLMLPLAP